MRLVDTNVLLDLVTDDPDWAAWSIAKLEEAALAGLAVTLLTAFLRRAAIDTLTGKIRTNELG